MTPRIRNTASYKLNIPTLSGGVNLRDGVSLIQDNQLTECKNMYFKNGMLRTRPGIISTDKANNMMHFFADYALNDNITVDMNPENFIVINDIKYTLAVIVNNQPKLEETVFVTPEISYRYIPEDIRLAQIELGNISCPSFLHHLTFQHNGDIYSFVTTELPDGNEYHIYKIKNNGDGTFSNIKETSEDIYAPLVLTDCVPSPTGEKFGDNDLNSEDVNYFEGNIAYNIRALDKLLSWGAVQYEEFNFIGNYYRMVYSTVNPKSTVYDIDLSQEPDRLSNSYMAYPLLDPIVVGKFKGKRITATIEHKDGKRATHIIEIDGTSDEYWENTYNKDDDLRMWVRKGALCFNAPVYYTNAGKYSVWHLMEDDYIPNNMTITAPCGNVSSNNEKIFRCTKTAWYGGTSEGIHGGSRLFLSGNVNFSEKAFVAWSSLENPLYFPEHNYAYVGDKSQRITTLGRQSSMLVIFKEQEMFATQYQEGLDITAKKLINQSVVGVEASSAYFPIIQLSGAIGCDCPNTVQLCRNRLIWANSDGNVYTLVSQSQNSERTVFSVSAMIGKRLREENLAALTKAFSADYEGCYLLFVGNKVYVMDYNSYGFHYVSSYSKDEDANLKIPWYIWEMPEGNYKCAVVNHNKIVIPLIKQFEANNPKYSAALTWCSFDVGKTNDTITIDYYLGYDGGELWESRTNQTNIFSSFTTKLYDFGQPTVKKNIPKIELSFGSNGAVPITVQVITEQGTEEHTVVLDEGTDDEASPIFFTDELIRPIARNNKRIALKISSDGGLFIGPVSLQYKMLGGIK